MSAPEVEIRREAGYYSVYVNGRRTVDRESYIVASNVADAIRDPRVRALPTESAEVARSILRWLETEEAS